jgi:acetoin utilization deacetylase AcuC-like enzyme
MTTLYYSPSACLAHDTGNHHPESAGRLRAINARLQQPEFAALEYREAIRATREQLALIHTPAHIERVCNSLPVRGLVALDADTPLSPGSLDAALYAVGAVCCAVDAVFAQKRVNAFCAVRPPGHHAEPDQAMGFCLFNNVAIAAAHALGKYAIHRVAIVDFDVHHGNGTQAAFYHRPEVLYASTHQFPWYPGTGSARETGSGNIVNVPLPGGCDSTCFRAAVSEHILPALERFAPQLVLVSAGFDGHRDDPLAELNLLEADFGWITRELLAVAARHAAGRLVSVLEGGYQLDALTASVAAHVRAMMAAE